MLFVGALCSERPLLDQDSYRVESHIGGIGNGINYIDGGGDEET